MPSHIALLPCNYASLLPFPSARRWERRRRRTCVHPRARWRAPPRGRRRRTQHRCMSTVSSPSSFCRRCRRRRLLGPQAAARGTTLSSGCDARRAASAPSPPHHLHSTSAHSAPSVGRCTGTSSGPTWESERSSSVARARQRARRKGRACRSMGSGEMVGSRSVLRPRVLIAAFQLCMRRQQRRLSQR